MSRARAVMCVTLRFTVVQYGRSLSPLELPMQREFRPKNE